MREVESKNINFYKASKQIQSRIKSLTLYLQLVLQQVFQEI